MAADLTLVVQPTEADADELPSQGAGDALTEAGLPDARGPEQQQDGGVHVAAQLEHRQVAEDAVLHFFEAVVVLVELLGDGGEVEVVLGVLPPGQVQQRFEVGHLDGVLGQLGVHPLEAQQFPVKGLGDLLGPVLVLGAGLQAFDFGLVGVVAQFVLDGFHLLVEEVLPLLLLDVAAGLILDLAAQFQQLKLALEFAQEALGLFAQVVQL